MKYQLNLLFKWGRMRFEVEHITCNFLFCIMKYYKHPKMLFSKNVELSKYSKIAAHILTFLSKFGLLGYLEGFMFYICTCYLAGGLEKALPLPNIYVYNILMTFYLNFTKNFKNFWKIRQFLVNLTYTALIIISLLFNSRTCK